MNMSHLLGFLMCGMIWLHERLSMDKSCNALVIRTCYKGVDQDARKQIASTIISSGLLSEWVYRVRSGKLDPVLL